MQAGKAPAGKKSARIICFESFRRQRAERLVQTSEPETGQPFGVGNRPGPKASAGEALSPRQIAHRRAILEYWSQLERIRITAAAPAPVSRPY
jgi:hypothetical protein